MAVFGQVHNGLASADVAGIGIGNGRLDSRSQQQKRNKSSHGSRSRMFSAESPHRGLAYIGGVGV
jgi:hypothetical protein